MQGHGIKGVGEKRKNGNVLQSFNKVDATQQPKTGKPGRDDSCFEGRSQANGCEHGCEKHKSIVYQKRTTTLPSVFRKYRLFEQTWSDHEESKGKPERDEGRNHVSKASNQFLMLLVVQFESMNHVTEHEEGQIDGSRRVNHRDAQQRHAQAQRVMSLAFLTWAQEYQDTDDETKLTGYTWVT